ncbi:cell division protein PerM [Streptomyces sp. 8N616]
MTQSTDRNPALPPSPPLRPSQPLRPSPPSLPLPPRGQLAAGGVVAAALGLGAVTVAVLLLWITSPYPESGPSGALHAAAALWLLAHGAELVRTDTLSGAAAPIGLTPLLLSALPLWLLYRAAGHALEAHEEELAEAGGDPDGPPPAGPTIGWLSAGYLLTGVAAVIYASGGPLHVDPLSALLHLPVVTVAAVSYGYWAASGRPREPLRVVMADVLPRVTSGVLPGVVTGPLPGALLGLLPGRLRQPLPARARRAFGRVPGGVRAVRARLTRRRLATAVRGGTAGTAVLLGGGALLVAFSLTWHGAAAQQSFQHLTEPWTGRLAVLLLALALVPNAVVWGAAYGLGPGFTLGAGSVVGPLGASAHPELPHFPLLAALPDPGPGGPLTWPVATLPLAAGVTVGWYTARAAVPGSGRAATGGGGGGKPVVRNWRDTALTAALGSAACAVAMALLAGLAGGSLGTGALEDFGPSWWLTGVAALCWTAPVAGPTALVARWWRKRRPTPADATPETPKAPTPAP